jgi:hypothetical protein
VDAYSFAAHVLGPVRNLLTKRIMLLAGPDHLPLGQISEDEAAVYHVGERA